MNILIIDNYDSFTYNLCYLLRGHGATLTVHRNDRIPEQVFSGKGLGQYSGLVLSPGPGTPDEAGQLQEIIACCVGKLPVLGVCLGHQALASHFGATISNMAEVYHGMETAVHITEKVPLFRHMPRNIRAGRYHSWVVDDPRSAEN